MSVVEQCGRGQCRWSALLAAMALLVLAALPAGCFKWDWSHLKTGCEQGATVEDTGTGIAENDEAYIFRRAYRGRESATQGSGLGLAIVHRLCQRYGWRIGFDSTQGQGTRIWLAFSP